MWGEMPQIAIAATQLDDNRTKWLVQLSRRMHLEMK
jgi:hypothetical protein